MSSPESENLARPTDARMAELDLRIAELTDRLSRTAPAVAEAAVQQQNDRIADLQRLVVQLGDRVAALPASAALPRDAAGPGTPASPKGCETAAGGSGCGCHEGPCGCLSCDCCSYEVWMTHVRVDHMQIPIELADNNASPMNEMEVWMFATIDPLHNIGVCIPDPSPSSYLPLHKQLTDPYGPWVSVNRCVGSVTVSKGAPQTVTLTLTGVERETDRGLPMDRDEWGSASETLTLDCCASTYAPILMPVALNSWGQGGGAITAKFMIVRKC